jgi:2-methylisocitrate lyase-like PEP mutase family enzyme
MRTNGGRATEIAMDNGRAEVDGRTSRKEGVDRATQRERAAAFQRLHAGARAVVLVNAWDAASARLLEEAGQSAIATTSAGMAWSLGYADGEQMGTQDLVAACRRICRVVKTPVSVDIERGFGSTAGEVCAVVRPLLDIGVVGINIEDGVTPGTGQLAPPEILAERIAALRALVRESDGALFINARTDTYFAPAIDPASRDDETVRRARIYVEAGADGIFVPGLVSLPEISRLARTVARPLNIYAGHDGVPSIQALEHAGVRRVSLGCGPLQAALALTRRIAREALEQGTYAAMTADMIPGNEANELFRALSTGRTGGD